MTALSLRGLLARKLRTILTGFAVIIGVAFVAGTFIFTDTLNASFDDLFKSFYKGTDVTVTAKQPVEGAFGGRTQPLPEGTFEKVEGLEGVAALEQQFDTEVTLLDKKGKPLPTNGPPTLLATQSEDRFDVAEYAAGGPARENGTITVDQATANAQGYKVGDTLTIAGRAPAKKFELVGITTVAGQNSLGIRLLNAPLAEVQRIARQPGALTAIAVAAEAGVSQDDLKRNVAASIGDTAVVSTGEEAAAEGSQDISDGLGFLSTALLVFAAVSLLVGGFLIFNTFAVTVAQRSGEFALLRTLGASRGQIMRSVVVESLIIGTVASIIGILGGMLVAPALRAMLSSFGVDMPSTGTVVAPRTIIAGLAVGILVTLISGIVPALRATRVQPVEAMRDAGAPTAKPVGRRRIVFSLVLLAIGIAALIFGLVGAEGASVATLLGGGVLAMIFGVAILAPVLIRPLARAVGAPLVQLQGMPGRLARENTERQPQRTAITASALMIGLALVVFTAVFAAGLRGSVDKTTDALYGQAKLMISSNSPTSSLSPEVAQTLKGSEGVTAVSSLRFDQGNVEGVGDAVPVTGVEPASVGLVFTPEIAEGPEDLLSNMTEDQIVGEERWLADNKLAVGDVLRIVTPKGTRTRYEIAGSFKRNYQMGSLIVTNASLARDWNQPDDASVIVTGPGDANELKAAVQKRLSEFPATDVKTIAEFKESASGQVNQLLGLVYGLLALSVIVALLGIVNTLALAIHERKRELGLLRAVGMSRRQVRQMVRTESVITALIGALLGAVLGVVLAIIVSRPLAADGFVLTIPWSTLIILAVLAALAGVIAAIPPARRAAKVDVLRAITNE